MNHTDRPIPGLIPNVNASLLDAREADMEQPCEPDGIYFNSAI